MKQGWELRKLGDIGKVSMCKRVFKEQTSTMDDIPFYKIGTFGNEPDAFISQEIYNEFKRKFSFPKKGDILISASGTIGRRVRYDGEPAYFQDSNIVWIDNDEKQVLNDYLYHFYENCIWESTKGATISRLYNDNLRQIEISFPKSLPEQHRIVSLLDQAFAAIDKAKANAAQNLKNARELFESYLEGVFENGNWEEKRLEEVCILISKGSSPKWQGIKYVDAPGVLFVTSENVGENTLMLEQRKYVEEKFNISDKKSILKKGDVLTNIVGASIGRTAIFDLEDIANINQAVCLIRCNQEFLFNEYLMYLLNSPFTKQHLHDNEVNNARANLSLGFFRSLLIPVPKLTEQKAVVNKIKAFHIETQKLEAVYQKKIADLEELKKSILQKAFAGELKTEKAIAI